MGDWSNLVSHVSLVEVRDNSSRTLNSIAGPSGRGPIKGLWVACLKEPEALLPTKWELQTFCHRTVRPRHLPRLRHGNLGMSSQPGKHLHSKWGPTSTSDVQQ